MPKAKKLPSGSWRVRVYSHTDANGVKKYKSFTAGSKKEAEYLAAQFQIENSAKGSEVTVQEAITRYIQSKDGVLSPATIFGYNTILNHHLHEIKQRRICDLTTEVIQRCINNEAKEHSAKTVANVCGLLMAAIHQQDPDKHFSIRLPRKVKKLRRNLPTSQDVIEAVRGTPAELPALLAMWLCLRISEVRGIKKSAVSNGYLEICLVRVAVGGHDVIKELTKTDATRRVIELPKLLEDMIMRTSGEFVIDASARSVSSRFVRLMEKNGFKGVRFHDLRHIAASDMNKLGIPDKVAAERGGWATTDTMRSVYQHSFSEDRKKADALVNDYYYKLIAGAEQNTANDECNNE